MALIRKEIRISAVKDRVFRALTDPAEIRNWSGAQAEMDISKDGRFSLCNGGIVGINSAVNSDRIVQKWKDSKWGAYSNLIYEIQEGCGCTNLKVIHFNVPESSLDSINEGWESHYLNPLKCYLEKCDLS